MNIKNNKEENDDDDDLKKKIDDFVRQSAGADSGPNYDLDDERLIGFLDSLVKDYNLNRAICSPSSNLIKRSDKHISEAYSNVDCRFILTAVTEKKLSLDPTEVDLRLGEMREFYLRENLKKYKFRETLSAGAIDKHWGNRLSELEIMEWRWDNGLAFMDYQDRVMTYLDTVVDAASDTNVRDSINKHYHLQSAVALLKTGFKNIDDSDLLSTIRINRSTRNVIAGFASGRLSLDKIAKDQIYRNWLATRSEEELDDAWDEDSN